MGDDDSVSDSSDVARLFDKSDAGIKAEMARDSSDEEDDDSAVQLYMGAGKTNADNDVEDSMNETAMRRAARERLRRSARFNSDDEDDDEVTFIPKSQIKKTVPANAKVISLLGNSTDGPTIAKNMYQDSSDDEEEDNNRPTKCARSTITAASASLGFKPETSRKLMELRASSRRVNANAKDVYDVDDVDTPTTTCRWIKVLVDGTDKTESFNMSESDCAKDLISKCIEKFQFDPSSPIALLWENRILGNTELFFDIPVQCEMVLKVHNLAVKEAPKGKLMRLTLRGPSGEKEIVIGELQTMQVALDQYGAGTKLKFDGDVMDLGRRPGFYELEDEDLIDVA